jgi:hypothetical protein
MAVTLAQRISEEVTIYGGLPMRRRDVYILASEHLGSDAGPPFGADWFAFGGATVDAEPWPLEEARRIMEGVDQ